MADGVCLRRPTSLLKDTFVLLSALVLDVRALFMGRFDPVPNPRSVRCKRGRKPISAASRF